MTTQPNNKIVGAFVIGFALTAGAYVVSNFGNVAPPPKTQAVVAESVVTRKPITVTDTDNNGIEDWKEELLKVEPIELPEPQAESSYVPPETLTGQFGIRFFEDIVRAKNTGGFGASNEELVSKSVKSLEAQTQETMYRASDFTIIPDSDQAIRDYANSVATIIFYTQPESTEDELEILRRAVTSQSETEVARLEPIANSYKRTRDALLALPVPSYFVDAHLVFVNSYQALYHDVEGMRKVFEDPLLAFVRAERYLADVEALGYGLTNMYYAVENTPVLFTPADPAAMFYAFAPNPLTP